jgi:hypothetical protein
MKRLLMAFGVLGWFLLGVPPDIAAQTHTTVRGKVQYAVKFVCGPSTASGGGPSVGHYSTHVNIHNPDGSITFARKVAVGFGTLAGFVSGYVAETLLDDVAGTFNCGDIKNQVPGATAFLEGFLVIVSPKELDVTAVYTAEISAGSGVTSMHINVIQPRKLLLTVTAP